MGLFNLIKRKINLFKEQRLEEQRAKEKAKDQFQIFLEETKSYVNSSTNYPEAALYRTAWKRAIVLENIFKKINEINKSKPYRNFKEMAAKEFFKIAPSNPYRSTKLELSQKAYDSLYKKELKNLPTRLKAINEHQIVKKRPAKRVAGKRKRKSNSLALTKPAFTIRNYKLRGDGTAIDNFVDKLVDFLPSNNMKISVSGLTTHPRRSSGKSDWISIARNPSGKYKWEKIYKVGLLIDQNLWFLNEMINNLREIGSHSTENYYDAYLKPIADRIYQEIKSFVYEYDRDFLIGAGLKSNGKVSAWIRIKLPICVHDAIVHCGTYITDYPKKFLDEFEEIVEKKISNDLDKLIKIYKDYEFRYKFFRNAEQSLRKKHGIPLIGKGHITQGALYNLIQKFYPNAKHEHSPSWLGMQRFDIYIPNIKLAIEYNGSQHYMPIDIFGGEEGFIETQKRDDLKKKLSTANNVSILEWPYTRPVNEKEVKIFVEEIEKKFNEKTK